MYYSSAQRAVLKEKQPELKATEYLKAIGASWKELGDEAKKPFEEQAAKDKERHAEEMKNYTPPVQQEDLDSSDSDSSSSSSSFSSSSSLRSYIKINVLILFIIIILFINSEESYCFF